MSKTFVVSDLHGRADLLKLALKEIDAASAVGGTIVFTGDYVDRGWESAEVLRILMHGPSHADWWTWIPLLGNHEDFMYKSCRYGANTDLWMINGGTRTLLSFGQKAGEFPNPNIVPEEVVSWIGKLRTHYEDQHRIYVHAGLVEGVPLSHQSHNTLIWMRYDKEDEGDPDRGKHVVHGHEYYEDGPLLLKYRSDFDTNAWYTGRLVIGVFDDDTPGGPIDTITVQGPTAKDQMEKWRSANAGYGENVIKARQGE